MSKKGNAAASAVKSFAPLSQADADKTWQVLGLALSKEEVAHPLVQSLAEKLWHGSVAAGQPDAQALEVLVVALVQQSKWTQIVQLLSAQPALVASPNSELAFHYAYALYRDKQHARSLDELRRRGSNLSDGELHLQAQALYRAGQYAAAARVYRDTHLAEEGDDVELQANLLAALVSAGQLDEAKAYIAKLNIMKAPESYELAYNAACGLVECGEYPQALQSVRRAQSLCQEVLEADDASEGDIERELAGLRVQEAFILQQLAKLPGADVSALNEQALALYTQVLSSRHPDPNASSIASNNVITLRQGGGGGGVSGGAKQVWDSLKQSSKANAALDLKDMTLSLKQKSALQLNRALALMQGKQYEKCKEVLTMCSREFAGNVFVALAQAAVLSKEKGGKLSEAEQTLTSWLRAHEATAAHDAVQSVYLALAHLSLLKGDAAAAAHTLTTLMTKGKGGAAFMHRPATVATLVALYERANDIDSAHSTIQAAIKHWSAEKKGSAAAARSLQRILSSAGAFYSRHGREADAAQLLELLAAETQSGTTSATSRAESVARLVLAYASGKDESKQAQYVAQLPELQVPAELDVQTLESVPAPEIAKRRKNPAAAAGKKAAASAAAGEGGEEEDDEEGGDEKEQSVSASLAKAAARKALKARQKAKAKSKEPRRYPKGFDPANPGPMPDPERWLPRWERSNQKKYRNRGKQQGNAIRGAQGSTNMGSLATATSSKEAAADTSVGVEQQGKMSGAAAAAARKRAGKKAKNAAEAK